MLMTLAGINLFLAVLFAVVAYRDPDPTRLAWSVAALVALAEAVVMFIRSTGV